RHLSIRQLRNWGENRRRDRAVQPHLLYIRDHPNDLARRVIRAAPDTKLAREWILPIEEMFDERFVDDGDRLRGGVVVFVEGASLSHVYPHHAEVIGRDHTELYALEFVRLFRKNDSRVELPIQRQFVDHRGGFDTGQAADAFERRPIKGVRFL